MTDVLRRFIDPRPALPEGRQLFTDRALKAMIVPLLIEQLLQLVVGIADTMMVSYAGEATVSGVSLDTMIYTIFIYLFTAVATGGAVIVSQYIGRGDRDSANLAASQGYFIAGAVSLVCLALTLLFGNAVLARLYAQVDGEVMRACRVYLRIVALSTAWNALVTLLVPMILPLYAVTAETRHFIWVVVIIHNIFAALVQPFAMPLSSGLRAAGDVQFSLWSSLLCTVLFRTALSFALGLWLGLGIVGIAWAMVLDWCLKALLDVLRFRGGKWRDKRVI